MKELVIIGFSEKHRALEVLPQLQRLRFGWTADLNQAVAVEVEKNGRLRLFYGQLLDPADASEEAPQWKAVLSAILPLPHVPSSGTSELMSEVHAINAQAGNWLDEFSRKSDFIRDAAALLRPGNSAVFARIHDWRSALPVLLEYSNFVLHTGIEWPKDSAIFAR